MQLSRQENVLSLALSAAASREIASQTRTKAGMLETGKVLKQSAALETRKSLSTWHGMALR